MAAERQTKTEVKAPSKEETARGIDYTLGELLAHVASIDKSLARLADKFAPEKGVVQSFPGGRRVKVCERGHGMQPTDEYCQTCYREDHGGAA